MAWESGKPSPSRPWCGDTAGLRKKADRKRPLCSAKRSALTTPVGPQSSRRVSSCTSPTVEGQHWQRGGPPGTLRAGVFSLPFDFGVALPCSCQLERLCLLPRSTRLCCRPAFAQRRHLWSCFLRTVWAGLTFCSEVSGDSWVPSWAPGWEVWPLGPNHSSHLSGLPSFSEDTAQSQEAAVVEEGRAQEEMGQGAPGGGGGTGRGHWTSLGGWSSPGEEGRDGPP